MGQPLLIIFIGLPGTGKTTSCNLFRKKVKCHFFNSDIFAKKEGLFKIKGLWKKNKREIDKIRKNFYLKKSKELSKLLLKKDIVIMDSVSNKEFLRKILYNSSKKAKGKTLLIEVKAPLKLTKDRILRDKNKNSRTRWETYLKIRKEWQPIKRKHYKIDSSDDISKQIDKIIIKERLKRRNKN